MFGNVPKALWQRWIQPDVSNRIPLACRCFLIKSHGKLILLETGIGAFFSPKLKERFGVVESEHVLLANLKTLGVQPGDIDAIILSHLHFDHAGGLLTSFDDGELALAFTNSLIITSDKAWERAQNPHPRDRASFIPELTTLLKNSPQFKTTSERRMEELPGLRFHYSDGHTPGLMLTEIDGPEGPLLFAADLIPGTPWVHLPITMGYDRYPERIIEEKESILKDLHARNGGLLFTHDHQTAMAQVGINEKGKFFATTPLVDVSVKYG